MHRILLPSAAAVSLALAGCGSSESSPQSSEPSTQTSQAEAAGAQAPAVSGKTPAPNAGPGATQKKLAGNKAPADPTAPTLYVGGRLQTADRPAAGAELAYAVVWEDMDDSRIQWFDLTADEGGAFILDLPGIYRDTGRELSVILRPRKPKQSPFKYLNAELPFPLPEGPVNLGTLTIERREGTHGGNATGSTDDVSNG